MEKTLFPTCIQGTLTAPASKSYAQRALAAALLVPVADGAQKTWSKLHHLGLCNDTAAALDAVQRLGATVEHIAETGSTYRVRGGFLAHHPKELHVGESGLSARLFTPIAAQSPQPITISGHGSILKRPVAREMAAPLQALGASLTYTGDGFLPLTVCGPLQGGAVEVDGSLSSQFITGLLMAAPLSRQDTLLQVHNPKSIPYLEMTLEVLRAFGITVTHTPDYTQFTIPGGQPYQPTDYSIEGDWSGASCLLVGGAVASIPQGAGVRVENLNPNSLQADRAIVEALTRAGAILEWDNLSLTVKRPERLRAFSFDATNCPDLFPALVALAACCEGTTCLKGTTRLTHKESNRAATLATEFGKLGVAVDIALPDLMTIQGLLQGQERLTVQTPQLDSHNDHRIAMAATVAALRADRMVTVSRADAVEKSYPAFWDDLAHIIQRA